jgi:hypothetical protein
MRKRYLVILVTCIICLVSYKIGYRIYVWSGGSKYTIGTTLGTKWAPTRTIIVFEYTINGITYRNRATYAYESKFPNGRYLVKYGVIDPNICELYQDKQVPLSLIAPKEGWLQMPNLQER